MHPPCRTRPPLGKGGPHTAGWIGARSTDDNRRMSAEGIRVALADDHVLLREGLASLLDRSGFDVVGQCGDGTGLIDLVRRQRPDLVVVDIRMPPRHDVEGLEAARQIRAEFPGIAILVLSAHVEVEHAMDLLSEGQRTGYLLKSRVIDVDDFTETLRRLARGGSAVDPALVAEPVPRPLPRRYPWRRRPRPRARQPSAAPPARRRAGRPPCARRPGPATMSCPLRATLSTASP